MCDPVTMATIAVAQGTFTAYQQVQEGKYQRGVAEYNARVAENEAEQTRTVGVEQENIQRQRTAELISKQRAQLGAANVDVGSGSALQLQEDAATLGETDALRIRSNFENRAESLDIGAELTRDAGRQAERSANTRAFGTLLGTAASVAGTGVADKWFTANSSAVTLAGNPTNVNSIPIGSIA